MTIRKTSLYTKIIQRLVTFLLFFIIIIIHSRVAIADDKDLLNCVVVSHCVRIDLNTNDINKTFEEQSDLTKDEYVKAVQEIYKILRVEIYVELLKLRVEEVLVWVD